ncbi:MAG: hypothetical protein AB8C84_05005 [Oligoflexales bacterium]
MMKKSNIFVLVFLHIFTGCLPDASLDDPGVCALQCESAYLANRFKNTVQFEFLSGGEEDSLNLNCADAIALAQIDADEDGVADIDPTQIFWGPIALYFGMTSPIPRRELNDDTRELESATDPVPVSAVSFEPIVYGLVDESQTNPAISRFGSDASTLYRGVLTSPDSWCSDACGIAKVEIVPRCMASGDTNTVNVLLHSGSVVGTASVITEVE